MRSNYVVFVASLLLTYVCANCPDFIKPCKHSDYQCINNTIMVAARELNNGLPDFNIPSFNSVKVSELKLPDDGALPETLKFNNIALTNVLQFFIKLMKWKDKVCTIDLEFPLMVADGDMTIHFNKPFGFTRKGSFAIKAENINCLLHLSGVKVRKNKKEYFRLNEVEMKLTVPRTKMKFDNGKPLENMLLGTVLAFQEEKIHNAGVPIIEKLASEYIKSLINRLTNDCTCRELFLD